MRTKEQHANALAAYLPNGRMFEAKNIDGSNLRQLLRGLAGELSTAQGYLKTLEEEYFPDTTELFLSEWERVVGIPDDCFDGAGTIAERRTAVIVKLVSLGAQTAEDFEVIAALFGKTVTVSSLAAQALPPYSVPFTPAELITSRFVMLVEGPDISTATPPYDVPFTPESSESIMECLFNKMKPANCTILFRNN